MSSAPRIKVYEYENCSTCRKALQFLEKQGIEFERLPIVERPPGRPELKRMLRYLGGDLKRLFNTSGQLYRELRVSEKLPGLSEDQAIDLLAGHGKLIKRPFLLLPDDGAVGFKEGEWKEKLKASRRA